MAGQGVQQGGRVGHHNQDGGPAANGLRVGHINIDGAISKIDTIRYFLEYHGFDIFFVSEAKASTRNEDYFEIKGYTHWLKNRRKDGHAPLGGGMLLYVREDLHASIEPFDDEDWATVHYYNTRLGVERLWIRMRYGDSHLDIAGIYIPPRRSANERKWEFTNPQRRAALLNCLHRFRERNNVIVLGDTNFDLLQRIPPQYPTAEILDMGFHQLINRATRIKSRTLLDHIYVRNAARNNDDDGEEEQQEMILESGNIRCGISDHDLIYCTVRYQNREQTFHALGDAAQFVQQHTSRKVLKTVFTAINERIQGKNNILGGSLFLPYVELLAADMNRLQTACENAFDDVTGNKNVEVWRDIRNAFMRYLKTAGYRDTKAAWEETGIDKELEDLRGFNFWKVKMYVHQNIVQNPGPQPLEDDDQRHVVHLTKERQNFRNEFQRLSIRNP